MKKIILSLLLTILLSMGAKAQQAITIVGGGISNSRGSISLSGGEVAVQHSVARAITVVNITSYFTEGVQQAFGIIHNDLNSPLPVEIAVGPNPTRDWVDINVADSYHGLNYTLYSLKGETIQKDNIVGEKTHIEMGNLPTGTYRLYIENENHSEKNVYKIIKAK